MRDDLSKRLRNLISDEEVARVHGNANFGDKMTPRMVIAEGVLHYAYGYHCGYTMMSILIEHKLIRKPKPGTSASVLTKKGLDYLREAIPFQQALKAVTAADRIDALTAERDALQGKLWGMEHAFEEQFGAATESGYHQQKNRADEAEARLAAAEARAQAMHRRAQKAEGGLDAAIAEAEMWCRIWPESFPQSQTQDMEWHRRALFRGAIIADIKKRLHKARAALAPKEPPHG